MSLVVPTLAATRMIEFFSSIVSICLKRLLQKAIYSTSSPFSSSLILASMFTVLSSPAPIVAPAAKRDFDIEREAFFLPLIQIGVTATHG